MTLGGESWLGGPPDITAQVGLYKNSVEDDEPPVFEITADVFHLSSSSSAMDMDMDDILKGTVFSTSDNADGKDHVVFRHDEIALAAPYNLYGPGLVDGRSTPPPP